MKTFRSRLWRNLAILLGCGLGIVFAYELLTVSLRPTRFYTGWALFGLMLLLASYNLFKKVPFLNLGSSAAWLQLHIYAGWLTVLLFALHLGPRLPPQALGLTLTGLYLGVAGSGGGGLALSRFLPPRLSARGEEVLYERIPAQRRQLQEKVEELVLRSVKAADSTSIADLYVRRLKPFFDGPRHFWRHLLHSNVPRRALLAEARDQQRYMNEQEREILHEIVLLIQAKDDLDYQYALQSALKWWLFVHVPLTYSLLIFSLLHLFLVYTFSGVVR